MLDIDLEVACHKLTVHPYAWSIVQHRRKQTLEKAEAAKKVVSNLLAANFISDAKYTAMLSNVVLIKKNIIINDMFMLTIVISIKCVPKMCIRFPILIP